jgi:TRAP-type transport system periplasmic protein
MTTNDQKLFLAPAIAAAAAIALAASGAHAAEITLRLGHDQPTAHAYHHGAEFFAERVAELTDGQVEIRIFPGAQLGNEMAMLDSLVAGNLDLSIAAAANSSTYIPEFGFFSVSYLFSGPEHFKTVLQDEEFNALLDEKIDTDVQGFRRISTHAAGVRNIYTNKPVADLEDLSGMRMRVMASPVESQVWSTLGTLPTSIPFGEVYTAMQTGLLEGAENAAAVYSSNKHFEVAPYYTLTGHQWLVALLFASEQTWADLPENVRDALLQAGEEMTPFVIDFTLASDEEHLAQLKEQGTTVSDIDVGPFMERIAPLQDPIAEELGMTDVLARIRELQ